jgi:tetratricopeptide (TPR) repeat protein
VQEVTYDTTPLGRRKDLHAQVAGAIERVFAERLEEFYSLLAYHYSKSEHWDRARDYLLKAGGQASNLGAGEAGNSYQQALEALLKGCDLRSGEDGSTQAIDWFLDGVGAFYDATHLASIRPALEIFHARATATFGPVDRRTLAAAEMLGAAYAEQYMFPEARAVLESTLHTRESLGDSDDPSLARLLRMLAMVAASQDRYEEADTLLSHALALQTAASDCDYNMLTEIYMGLLYVYNYSDRGLRRAAEVAERALTISELRQTPMYPVLLANICDLEMRRGRLAQAEAHARMGVEAARSWLYEGYCRGNLGDILMCQGRCYDALPELQQATDAMDTLGRSADLGSLLGILAECQLRLGQLEAAEESARRAINLLEKEPGADRASAAWAWRALAGVQLNRGALQDAERSIEKAASCLTEAYHEGEPFFEAELLFRQAQVRLKQGRGQEGQGDFARALELLTELGGEEHERKKVIQAQWETSMNRNGWAG